MTDTNQLCIDRDCDKVFFVIDGRQYDLVAVDGDTHIPLQPCHLDKCVLLDTNERLEQHRLFRDLREDLPAELVDLSWINPQEGFFADNPYHLSGKAGDIALAKHSEHGKRMIVTNIIPQDT